MADIGLSTEESDRIRSVFARYPEVAQVTLFGSRALGTHKPASDIDLAVSGAGIGHSTLAAIAADLDDLLLPYVIDLVDVRSIDNADLLEHIRRDGRRLY
jgi:predicted nucleotidyltransferase